MTNNMIEYLFPHFLIADKQGYAIAKAMEAGLLYMQKQMQDGMDILRDVEKMPEWRLDEVAWEEHLIYDTDAGVDEKRALVRNQLKDRDFNIFGTPYSLKQYIKGVEKEAVVREWWEYGGEPYHFQVEVDGVVSGTKTKWAQYIIENVKNVRSVTDGIRYVHTEDAEKVYTGTALIGSEVSHLRVVAGDAGTIILDDIVYGVLSDSAGIPGNTLG